jgi:peptidoglycan/xylan/chitin deacetylase (PgdA/CDA1 family)
MPLVKVLPWKGHQAAVCLTFDDGDPSQLDVALPELNLKGLKATFFLIGNETDRKDDWRKLLESGHEIGSHSLDHLHAADLKTPRDLEAQVVGAQNVLQNEFGVPLYTFAYPYAEVTPQLEAQVGQTYLLARGGQGQGQPNLKTGMEPDWLNLPSKTMKSNLSWTDYKSWVDQDLKEGAWLIFMIHGLEGTQEGYEPITRKVFAQLLDYLQTKDIWVDTFAQVGFYFRAQKIFEKAVIENVPGGYRYRWNVPSLFPPGIRLQIEMKPSGSLAEVFVPEQGGIKLKPDKEGIYTLEFNKGEMELLPMPKS